MEIHFETGDKCLLNCRHCSSMASKVGGEMEYSEKDISKLLQGIKEKKRIFLTGGEPLLYSNILDLFKYLQTQIDDIELGIFTSGIVKDDGRLNSISEQFAERLAACGLKICYLSVYSHLKQEHDWMTNFPGSFNLLNKSIESLRKAGIEIRFNSVVTKKNMSSYGEIIKFAEHVGATEVRMLKLIEHGRARNCWQEIGITNEQYRATIEKVTNEKNKIRITASGVVDILPCRCEWDFLTCPAGKKILYITKKGDIFPCASVKSNEKYRIGNITDEEIIPKIHAFQKRINKELLCK